jgi:hypothetical protein
MAVTISAAQLAVNRREGFTFMGYQWVVWEGKGGMLIFETGDLKREI